MSEMNHDDLNQLVQELRANKPAAPLPPAQFTVDLRRELLDQYAGKRRLRVDFDWLGSMAGSVAAFIVLGAAVLVAWFAFSRGSAGVNSLQPVVDLQPPASEDRVWVISVHQAPRATAGAPIDFEVVMGYELVSAPEATMKLHLAHPDWELAGSGRAPIDGVTDFVAVTADQDSATFNFTVNPAELESIIGTASPVLVAMLSEPAPVEADGRLDTYAMETFTDLRPSLFALDKPVSTPPDIMGARGTIGVVSIEPDVLPPVEMTLTGNEPITFEAPIFYELSGVPETEVEVSLSEQTTDGVVSAWIALDTERVPVEAGRGLFHVVFTLDPTTRLYQATTVEMTVGMVVPGSEEYRITNRGVASRSWRYEP